MFAVEQIKVDLFPQISLYFLMCHLQWNLCLQNRHRLESAWWSPQQLEYLNMCGHSLSFFVSRQEGLIFSFTLQHHPNWWWFSVLWGPLHLTYLDPWIQQDKVVYPYHQQFLYWGTLRFILAPQIVVINLPTLKHLFIRLLALLPLWTSQMLIQMIDISDLGEILMMCSFDARTILSKIDSVLLCFQYHLVWDICLSCYEESKEHL